MKRIELYEKLDEKLSPRGTGLSGLTSTLIKRTKRKAIYLRSDGYYEIFRIEIQKAGILFGKKYPAKELYPNNEKFGHTAFCTASLKLAEQYYRNI